MYVVWTEGDVNHVALPNFECSIRGSRMQLYAGSASAWDPWHGEDRLRRVENRILHWVILSQGPTLDIVSDGGVHCADLPGVAVPFGVRV